MSTSEVQTQSRSRTEEAIHVPKTRQAAEVVFLRQPAEMFEPTTLVLLRDHDLRSALPGAELSSQLLITIAEVLFMLRVLWNTMFRGNA